MNCQSATQISSHRNVTSDRAGKSEIEHSIENKFLSGYFADAGERCKSIVAFKYIVLVGVNNKIRCLKGIGHYGLSSNEQILIICHSLGDLQGVDLNLVGRYAGAKSLFDGYGRYNTG